MNIISMLQNHDQQTFFSRNPPRRQAELTIEGHISVEMRVPTRDTAELLLCEFFEVNMKLPIRSGSMFCKKKDRISFGCGCEEK